VPTPPQEQIYALFSSECAHGKQKLQLWRRCRFFPLRGVQGLPPIGHCRIFVPLFRSASRLPAAPPPRLPASPPLATPPHPSPSPDRHPSSSRVLSASSRPVSPPLAASFPLLPSSTCYRSRNGRTLASGRLGGRAGGREGGREGGGARDRTARGREQSSSGGEGGPSALRTVETKDEEEDSEGGRYAGILSLPLLFTRFVAYRLRRARARARVHAADTFVRSVSERCCTHTYARVCERPALACPPRKMDRGRGVAACTRPVRTAQETNACERTDTCRNSRTRTRTDRSSASLPPLSLSLSLSLSCIAFLLSANHRSVSLYLLVLLLRGCASSLHPFLPHSFTSSRGSEHSLANLPYTFVCLNWVASYTRAWSVNRILNYYSDCVSLEGAPISVGVLVHLFAHPPTLPHLVPRGVFTGTHAWCDDEDEYKYIFCIGRSGPFRQSPQLRVYARLRVMLGKLSDIPRMIFRSRHAYSRIESSHSSRLDPTTRNETIRNVLYGRKARKRVRDFDNLTVASTVFDARLRWNDYARYTREFPRYFLSSSVAGLAEAESDRYF